MEICKELNAFAGCKNLVDIKLSDNLSSICEGVFYACTNIQTIVIPKAVKIIDDSAFCGCESEKIL